MNVKDKKKKKLKIMKKVILSSKGEKTLTRIFLGSFELYL